MTALGIIPTWIGIAACILQSALFSGLNLAVFSLSLLRLQIDADSGNTDAARVLELPEMAALTRLSAAIEPLLRVREGIRTERKALDRTLA